MPGPDLIEYREPTAVVLTEWTPRRVKAALADAQVGRLYMAADLMSSLLLDGRIQQAFKKRADALFRNEVEFLAGAGRRKNMTIHALEAADDYSAAFPESELRQLKIWGEGLGVGLGELVWKRLPQHGDRDIPVLKVWHPRWLRWDDWNHRWMLQVRADENPTGQPEIEIKPGEGKWILYTPYGVNRPWMWGLWFSLSTFWLLKQLSLADMAAHNKAHGSPQFVGKTPIEQVTKEKRDEFVGMLAEMVARSSIVLPKGWELDLLECAHDSSEAFERAIKLADTSFDIAILGNNLTTEVTGGSLAAANVHREVQGDQAASDDGALCGCLHDQALVHWSEYNYGASAAAPLPHYAVEPAEDLKSEAETINALSAGLQKIDAMLAPQGLEVDMVAMTERYGIATRKRTTPDPALVAAEAAAKALEQTQGPNAPDPKQAPAKPGAAGVPPG